MTHFEEQDAGNGAGCGGLHAYSLVRVVEILEALLHIGLDLQDMVVRYSNKEAEFNRWER